MRFLYRAACTLLGLALVACGGGGGGDAGGGDDGGGSGTSIRANVQSIDLVVRNVDDLPSGEVVVTFKGAGVAVGSRPGESLPSWLQVEAPTSSTSPVSVTVKADWIVRFEPQGVQSAVMRFATANADLSDPTYTDVTVNLVIAHQVTPGKMLFRATESQAAGIGEQPMQLQADGIDWSVTSSQPWLKPSRMSGSGSGSLSVGVDAEGLAPGLHTAELTVSDAAHAVDRVVPVQFILEAHELIVRRKGVALTSIGSYQLLSANIPTADNSGAASAWAAQSDQSWLHLGAATGSTGQDLAVTADPAGLADGMHYAKVTLSPTTAGVSGGSAVVVGLYVERTKTPVSAFWLSQRDYQGTPAGYFQMLADPVRPYVYINQSDERIDVHNIYTNEVVAQVTKAGAGWGTLAIAPDGSSLLAADIAGGKLYRIDPKTWALSELAVPARVPSYAEFRMAAQVVGGKLLLATTAGELIDVTSKTIVADFAADVPIDNSGHIAFSNDGRRLVVQQRGIAAHDLYQLEVFKIASARGIAVSGRESEDHYANGLWFTSDDSALIAGTDEGGVLYSGVGEPAAVDRMRGLASPLAGGGFYAIDTDWTSVNRYAPSGALEATDVAGTGFFTYSLIVSGDQRRLMRQVDGGSISFIDAP